MVAAAATGVEVVVHVIDLPGGSGLRLTTMRYYTPGGRAIQVEGIAPDVPVDTGLASDGSVTILREHDLENHLPSESQKAAAPPARSPATEQPTSDPHVPGSAPKEKESVGLSPTHLGVARTVPICTCARSAA